MKILGIETSSSTFSLCLNEDACVLHEFRKQRELNGHEDGAIFEEARRLIDKVGGKGIDAIAISIGPGMFTSLRVGLALAKGIALVKHTPLVAVNTLDVIGVQPSHPAAVIVAVVDAYRGEVYAAFYSEGLRTSDYLLTTPARLLEKLHGNSLIVGPGAHIFAATALGRGNICVSDDDRYLPTAPKVVTLALPRIEQGSFDDIDFLEPYYIKKTDAERKYDKGNAF